MKPKNTSRIIAFVLALVMVVPLIGVPAFAEDTVDENAFEGYFEDFTNMTNAADMYASGTGAAAIANDAIIPDPTNSGKGNVWSVDVATHVGANSPHNSDIKSRFNYATYDSIVYQYDFYVEAGAVGELGVDTVLYADGSQRNNAQWYGFYSLDLTNGKIIPKATNGGSTVTATVNDASFKPDTWYTFAMVLDLKTSAYSLYLDGCKLMDAQMYVKNTTTPIANIVLVSSADMYVNKAKDSSTGTVYYDNVTVYEGTAPANAKNGYFEDFTGMDSAAGMYSGTAIETDTILSDPTNSGKGNVWSIDLASHSNANHSPNTLIKQWFNYAAHDSIVYQYDFYVENGAVGEIGFDSTVYNDGTNTSLGSVWHGLYSLDLTNGKIIHNKPNGRSTVTATVNDAGFKPGKWYNFAMALNLDTGAYSLYLDGYKVMDAQMAVKNFSLSSGILAFQKAPTSGSSGTVYYDNVTVYAGTAPANAKNGYFEDFADMDSAAGMYASNAGATAIANDAIVSDPTNSGKGNVWKLDVAPHKDSNNNPNAFIKQWFDYNAHDSIVYQYDFYVENGAKGQLGFDTAGSQGWHGLYSLDFTNSKIAGAATNNKSTYTATMNDAGFRTGKWYNFAMVLNLDTGAYSLYLDGYKVMEAQLAITNVSPSTLAFQKTPNNDNNSGTVYYDNVTVYEGTAPDNAKEGMRPYAEDFTGMTSAADMYTGSGVTADTIVPDPTNSGKGNVWKLDVASHKDSNYSPNTLIKQWFDCAVNDSIVYQYDFYVEKGATGELGFDYVSGRYYGLYSLDFTNSKIIHTASNDGSTVTAETGLASFATGKWYNFAMVMDLDKGAYSLYLDGYKVMDAEMPIENVSLSTSTIAFQKAHSNKTNSGTVYYDNVTVYAGTAPDNAKEGKRPYFEDFTGMMNAADMYSDAGVTADTIVPDPTNSGKGNVWKVDLASHTNANNVPNADVKSLFNKAVNDSVVYQLDFYVVAGAKGEIGFDAQLRLDGTTDYAWNGLYSLDLTNGKIIPRASNPGGTVTAAVNDPSFKTDTWYTLAMALDLKTGVYSLYLDGYKLMDARMRVENFTFYLMAFQKAKSNQTNSGTVYYDNVAVYAGTQPTDVKAGARPQDPYFEDFSVNAPAGSNAIATKDPENSSNNVAQINNHYNDAVVKSPFSMTAETVVLEADYYLDYGESQQFHLTSQIHTIKGLDADGVERTATWNALFMIWHDANEGENSARLDVNGQNKICYRDDVYGRIYVPCNEWFTVSVVVDRASGTYTVYVNGIAYASAQFAYAKDGIYYPLHNLSWDGSQWIVLKTASGFKDAEGSYVTKEGCAYVDNLAIYDVADTLKEVEVDAEKDFQYVDVTINGVNTKTIATKYLVKADDSFTATPVYFNENGEFNAIVSNVGKVSIRYGTNADVNPAGMRFATELDADLLAQLQAMVEAGTIKSVDLGTLIAPTDYIQKVEGKKDPIATSLAELTPNETVLDVSVEIGEWFDFKDPENYSGTYFVGSIVNLNVANYGRAFSAAGYVKVTLLSGESVYILADAYSQDVKSASKGILEMYKDQLSARQKTILQNYVDGVSNGTATTEPAA